MTATYPLYSAMLVREDLHAGRELALLDVREEAHFACGHPLFAAHFSLSRIELDAYVRLPNKAVRIVLYDDGEGYAQRAAAIFRRIGYADIRLLEDGLAGWRQSGGELFIDVNAPSKAFGELVEARRHTPALTAEAVQQLIDERRDIVVVDARRFDEYQTMSIPGAISAPGAELVLRSKVFAPNPATRIIVNCAGRTRSIIGAQSLINAGVPNPVAALRNGTIGWTLAQQILEHGQSRSVGAISAEAAAAAAAAARKVADRAKVERATWQQAQQWRDDPERTSYFFDVRLADEFLRAHLPGFRSAPGGQLVQETDYFAPVRGARIVLVDDDGCRANMTGSWLAQMGWQVAVLDDVSAKQFSENGTAPMLAPVAPAATTITPLELAELTGDRDTVVLDFTASANYRTRHIPGAWFVLRSQLPAALPAMPRAKRYVITCGSSALARFVADDLRALLIDPVESAAVAVLEGGTQAWIDAQLPLAHDTERMASPPIDRYQRPYEGIDNSRETIQDYLNWEYGLVEQLHRDGTHGFFVI